MLAINLEPDLVASNADASEQAHISAHILAESLGLSFKEFPAKQLKVRAEGPLSLGYLKAVAGMTELENQGIKVEIQDNFLILDSSDFDPEGSE